jgi:hypothetical protein
MVVSGCIVASLQGILALGNDFRVYVCLSRILLNQKHNLTKLFVHFLTHGFNVLFIFLLYRFKPNIILRFGFVVSLWCQSFIKLHNPTLNRTCRAQTRTKKTFKVVQVIIPRINPVLIS